MTATSTGASTLGPSERETLDDWGERDPRWVGIRDEWIEVRGQPVHLLRADGPGEGAPQLLLHGLGGSATNWLDVMAGLARRGPVVAPDLPGFGRTPPPHPGAPRITTNARFVWSLLRALGWEETELHGNSMGGLIAVLLSADVPELVRRLVLVAPALPTPLRAVHRIPNMAFATFAAFAVPGLGYRVLERRYERHSPEELYEMTLDLVHAEPERIRPALREVGIENAEFGKRTPWRLPSFVTAAESLVALHVGRRRVNDAADRVEVPTLVIWGESDRLVGKQVIDHLRRARPEWEVEVVTDCGHVPMIERPDRYLELVGAQNAGMTV